MIAGLINLLMTLTGCLLAGSLLRELNAPAPYMLGSLLGAWILGRLLRRSRFQPGIPRHLHIAIILGLSTLIGATFTPDTFAKLSLWLGSVCAMLVTTLLATWAGYIYLHKIRHYDSGLAILCSLPGGQAEVAAISRDLVEKDYVVIFCHLLRITTVLLLIPALLGLTQGSAGITASYVATSQMPDVAEIPPQVLLQFIGIAVIGYFFARLFGVPIPHLLGPLILSSTLHLGGWINIPRISEFLILAQIVIGGGIGARLANSNTKKLFSYLADAMVNTLIVIGIYCAVAMIFSYYGSLSPMQMLLAFIPGGIFEVTILALIFGFDVAFIAFHHTVRVLIIFLNLPFIVGLFKEKS